MRQAQRRHNVLPTGEEVGSVEEELRVEKHVWGSSQQHNYGIGLWRGLQVPERDFQMWWVSYLH